ncbi:UDP-galactopyranose mutase [Heliobacterium gestii]|uniref:UDP-galactopyranose mutase n=1 Tax=Heliomicrobium gestii TaxID=2699 RepID=A0A845LEY1_HELGE|nr:UDP-galactopyranose mutase [Heliomicrobium gestii]MBM7866715.1 UDP-galactopyranose mutase [Heliomicrobium gestii]MZP43005.1 UDP-galactopyranose mutase [Heliomicrobium gestii]
MFDYLIVGAGLAGCTLAERLASQRGARVLLVEKRSHIAGNAYDGYDDSGVLVHRYGAHLFHTNDREVFQYLSWFTDWHHYLHRVLTWVDGQLLPLPINLDTLNQLYGLSLTAETMEAFLASRREPREARNSEDVIVSQLGRELFEKFFDRYTRKQWGMAASELEPEVCARVPIRFNRDGRYFADTYQGMPKQGFTRMVERMIDHPGIKLMLNTDFAEIKEVIPYRRLIFTGPIDEYFRYALGRLPYRSLRFEFERIQREQFQPACVVNYPNEFDFTRIIEIKHATGQQCPVTTIVREYPMAHGEPYYPVPARKNRELYEKYAEEAAKLSDVFFVGRLGQYRYLNMDQVVREALNLFERL